MVDNSSTSALISGGTQGLGMAVAECLIKQGCTKLTITGRNADRGEGAAAQLREAGADCLFVPGLRDIATVGALVREVDGPVSVVMGLSGPPLSVAELGDAGVRRVSIGGSLARATFGLVRQAAREILDHGTFGYAAEQIPDAELCRLFSRASEST